MFYKYFNSPLRTAQIADTIWLQYNALTNYKVVTNS